jgi:transposase-like protein
MVSPVRGDHRRFQAETPLIDLFKFAEPALTNKFSPEVRTRAVRMVLDHEGEHASRWAAVVSISAKIGCTPQTLHEWVKKAEVDSGKRSGVPSEIADRVKALERENRELRQANEILRKASAYFAMAELDRRYKP